MEPVLIDVERTFGVELEGLIEGGGDTSDICTRNDLGCCCDCEEDCHGSCYGHCDCDDLRYNFECEWFEENPKESESYTLVQYYMLKDIEMKRIAEVECSFCYGECECEYCNGECECFVCRGECECDVCMGRCESCLDNARDEYDGQTRSELAQTISANCNIHCYSEDWNTRTSDHWKVIYDGSVSGDIIKNQLRLFLRHYQVLMVCYKLRK
jgi:hypothetical protein